MSRQHYRTEVILQTTSYANGYPNITNQPGKLPISTRETIRQRIERNNLVAITVISWQAKRQTAMYGLYVNFISYSKFFGAILT